MARTMAQTTGDFLAGRIRFWRTAFVNDHDAATGTEQGSQFLRSLPPAMLVPFPLPLCSTPASLCLVPPPLPACRNRRMCRRRRCSMRSGREGSRRGRGGSRCMAKQLRKRGKRYRPRQQACAPVLHRPCQPAVARHCTAPRTARLGAGAAVPGRRQLAILQARTTASCAGRLRRACVRCAPATRCRPIWRADGGRTCRQYCCCLLYGYCASHACPCACRF